MANIIRSHNLCLRIKGTTFINFCAFCHINVTGRIFFSEKAPQRTTRNNSPVSRKDTGEGILQLFTTKIIFTGFL